ncbi:MAG TPA: hypothetical protein VG755_40635 [Nannocystaceae bacterium]|nr:hypothetical protein [Nannocystaceae bacterium]
MPRVSALALAFACACGFGTNATDTDASTGQMTSAEGTTGTTGVPIVETCIADDGGSGTTGGDHHHYTDDAGQCYCDDGYTWRDPYNPNDFGCVEVVARTVPCDPGCDASAVAGTCNGTAITCDCAVGQRWCSDDAMRTECCDDPAQSPVPTHEPTTDSGSGTTADVTSSSEGGTTATG